MVKVIILTLALFLMSTKPVYTHYEMGSEIETKFSELKSEVIPSQIEILSVQWNGRELIVDVSEEITSYGGGNATEYEVVSQLLAMAFSIPEVESFTLLIEGEEDHLPEGTQISGYTRERYMEKIRNDYHINNE